MSVIKKETIDFRRVGTALIGGDFTGNARGTEAIDIQSGRSGVTVVASGTQAVAIGYDVTASGPHTTAIGHTATASGTYSTAIGHLATASGQYSTAAGYVCTASAYHGVAMGYACAAGDGTPDNINYTVAMGRGSSAIQDYATAMGIDCIASGLNSVALGFDAKARIQNTTNICGPQIIRKDAGEGAQNVFINFCGAEGILMSKEVDMKVVADHTVIFPANCHFWLNEVGIIATNIAGLIAQPTVRYGITGDLDKHGAAAITTDLTATLKREIETPLVPEDGETSLTGGVTIAADADTFLGRFYWKGMLIEDE